MDGNRITNLDDRRSSMKLKQLIKIAEAVTGKLPADMYELDEVEHYSIHRDEPVTMADMDLVYLVRAFKHQERMLRRQLGADTISDTVSKIARERDMWKEKALNMVEKETFDKVKDALAKVNREPHVKAEAYDIAWQKAEYWKKLYTDAMSKKGCNYVFSEIPNDTDGQEFVDTMKKYLNKESYKMRVRGQHIKPELRGTGATYWGQGLNESSHMRVYVDVK